LKINRLGMKRFRFFHPFLFAISPVLSLLSHNAGYVTPVDETIRPMIALVLFAVLLWLAVSRLTKDIEKSGVIVSAFLFVFFICGYSFSLITSIFVPVTLGLLALAASFLWIVIIVFRTSRKISETTALLNLVSVSLVGFNMATALYGILNSTKVPGKEGLTTNLRLKESTMKPNIYYIILDGYARSDVLNDVYRYQNGDFLDFLTTKGFYVATKSRANYCQTYLSLASSLNLVYLDRIASRMNPDSRDREPLIEMIRNSEVFSFLKNNGYRLVAFSTGVSGTEIRQADVYMASPWSFSEFDNALINRSLLGGLPNVSAVQSDRHRAQLLNALDHLDDFTDTQTPTILFAHIMACHPPFVFGEKGEAINNRKSFSFNDGIRLNPDRAEYIQHHRRQLVFITGKVQKAIGAILSRSTEPPIIILQSDHGPGSGWDVENLDRTDLRERMSILNAYYLPNGGSGPYPSITPVNTFRMVFNEYFGTHFEKLTDESYFATWNRPYQFVNVTRRLDAIETGNPVAAN
jgi:hypothetical protein